MFNTPIGKTELPESVSRIQDSKDRDADNQPGIKMSNVYWTEINENPAHPLYDLQQKINNLDCNDTDSVLRFFDQMTVPTGFYATTTQDEWGTWIQFMKEARP
jgi:hypothetical protein